MHGGYALHRREVDLDLSRGEGVLLRNAGPREAGARSRVDQLLGVALHAPNHEERSDDQGQQQ